MLIIREEQMKALSATLRQGFEDRVNLHLAAAFPAELKALDLSRPGIRSVVDLIRHGIKRASAYGIEAERDVSRFIELLVKVDPLFETRRDLAWATAILKNPSLTPHARIELVHELLPRRMPAAAGGSDKSRAM